jgi:hypothetical protein
MTERMLVTKLVYNKAKGHVDLIGKGHQYRDFILFDPTDLQNVGIDFETLEPGTETPCRFWVIYELSEKTNQAGNPYKDVIALEPIDKPATTSSVDTSAILDELRAIRQELVDLAMVIVRALEPP